MNPEMTDLEALRGARQRVAQVIFALNGIKETSVRSRELSLAVTNIEQGALWLERAVLAAERSVNDVPDFLQRAYALYDADPRVSGPEDFDAFGDAIAKAFDALLQEDEVDTGD